MTNLIWNTIYTQDGEHSKSKLTIIKFEKFSKAPKEKLFMVCTDYKSYQSVLPQFFPSIRIVSVRPTTTLIEEHRIISGRELVIMAKHVTDDYNSHQTFFVGGDAKGTQIIEKYETVSGGTKISISIDFKPKLAMKFSVMFDKSKLLDDFETIMDKFIEIAET